VTRLNVHNCVEHAVDAVVEANRVIRAIPVGFSQWKRSMRWWS
jgi:hypothetical protein